MNNVHLMIPLVRWVAQEVLEKIGIIERDDQGHVQVPWDEIDAHIRLARRQ